MNLAPLLRELPHRARFVPLSRNYAPKSRRMKPAEEKDASIPKNTLEQHISAHRQKGNGLPYDSKPFKMYLEAGKTYTWCLCGQGHTQPLCDGTHKFYLWDIKLRPVRFSVSESKEYYLCCCKQTKNRPFCDGSHRSPDVIEACKNKFTCTG
ncbi:CDGSH iron-sulfur domain-containing protein 3, mitochondrial [Planococcus citri]|uniref:CDGSH iron-sulfur domain-containing protein 3, mitochondrial n=1 Tax=Planococcus citri TaxID=170843 RepID=UPI0031F92671